MMRETIEGAGVTAPTNRVNLRFSVDVDLAAWRAEYGTRESWADIKESIRYAALEAIRTAAFGHLAHVLTVQES
jgi:hypothetical protein